MPEAAADDRGDLAFIIHALGNVRDDYGLIGRNDRRWRFQENQRLLGNFVVQFFRVLKIVAANANNLARRRGTSGRAIPLPALPEWHRRPGYTPQ